MTLVRRIFRSRNRARWEATSESIGTSLGAAAATMILAGAVSAAPAVSYAYSKAAPPLTADLAAFALQPPDEGAGEDEDLPDSGWVEPPIQQQPGTTPFEPPPSSVFGLPDTSTRRDTLPGFPQANPAPIETIAPRPIVPAVSSSGGATQQSAPEKTLFGLTPLAIVAGLIALHIVVVSVVAK